MKKFFVLISAVLMSAAAMAQTDGLAVNIGYNNPIFRDKSSEVIGGRGQGQGNVNLPGIEDKILYKGIKVGLFYDATIIRGFGVTMGVNYSFGVNKTKWVSEGSIYNTNEVRSESYIHSIEIPVDWQYKIPIASDTYFILYTGPTIQAHLYGRDKNVYRNAQHKVEERWVGDLFSDKPFNEGGYGDFVNQRYNVFWGIGAGFQYDRYFIRGGYDFGLINTYKYNRYSVDEDTSYKLSGRLDQWQIKLGIYLWSPNY